MDTILLFPLVHPVIKTISIGGSKSYTNRALIMASLGNGKSTLSSISMSDDSEILVQALRQLGIEIFQVDKETLEVTGNGGNFLNHNTSINVGHAGTAMRFLTALCSLVPGSVVLDGSSRMRERPIQDLVQALRKLGTEISYLENDGFPPIKILGGSHTSSKVSISGKVSSQFITALLLVSPALKNGLEITVEGEQISRSYIDMTIDGMKSFRVEVSNDDYKKYAVKPGQHYQGTQYQVEGDASGASYLFAIAAVSGSTITVENCNPSSAQGDIHFPDILEKMGCKVVKNSIKNTITVTGPKQLHGVSIDMSLMPDTAQTLAVVAAFAKGSTKITGLSTLKVKETDRLEAVKNELKKMGILCDVTSDSLTIVGGKPNGALIQTYKDHRMALSFSVAGSVIPDMRIENPSVVNKSFPGYWKILETLGVGIKIV